MSPLESSGKPLFFKVANPAHIGVEPPPNRRGVALRTVARSLAGMQKEALIRSSLTGAVWRLASDEGAYLMGDDVAPCPLAFMTSGMIASFMEEILVVARQRGIELGNIRLVQDNYYTMEGSALRGTMVGGAQPVELALEGESPAEPHMLGLLQDAIAASPATALLENILPSLFTLTHNGREIQTGRVMTIGRRPEPEPEACFERALPLTDGELGLIRRNGMSPKTHEVTSSEGSSYAPEQSRRLHLRGICTLLRPDGLKAIEVQLLNPHGSIFHFLSEEGHQAGGRGRAPDAMTYLSAGIAFCFMTQFGRYAKIARKNLTRYTVIQDTHFSMGGRGDGIPVADPVETHVCLESTEGDDFARTVLDMAEQTCFLHALCRSKLHVNAALTVAHS